MNKKYREALYDCFNKSIQSNEFVKRIYQPNYNTEYYYYEIKVDPHQTRGFIWFIVQSDQTFRVYGGWCADGQIDLTMLPVNYPIDVPSLKIKKDEPKNGKLMFGMSMLWGERRPKGWDIQGKTLEGACAEVDRVAKLIFEHAMPYYYDIIRNSK